MKELKNPRCENEKLKEGRNYCPICGLNLKRRTVPKDLKKLSEQLITKINNGEITLNQARKVLGMEPIKGGDVLLCSYDKYINHQKLANENLKAKINILDISSVLKQLLIINYLENQLSEARELLKKNLKIKI